MILQNYCTDCTASVFGIGFILDSRCYHFYLLLIFLQMSTLRLWGVFVHTCVCVRVRELICSQQSQIAEAAEFSWI